MSLSWYGLRRRRKNLSTYRIADEFPEGARVMLDSGCFSVNKDDTIDKEAAYELAQEYCDFVDRNIGAIEFASEFDALVLGRDLIQDIRDRYWANIDPQKFLPVWHSEFGSSDLRDLAGRYERVGVLQRDGAAQDVGNTLRILSGGTAFHGISMTKINVMKALPLASVGSTSWLSPTQFGDTFIWDGRDLHRYPKDYKHRRESHRRWLTDQGFDTQKIEADDNHELLRLSVWSWREFAKTITTRGVTANVLNPFPGIPETDPTGVAITPIVTGHEIVAPREDMELLPVISTVTDVRTEMDGTEVRTTLIRSSDQNLMQCDTCHISALCVKSQPGASCAYKIPITIRTSGQLTSVQDTLVEIQTGRVLRAAMFEQVQGGAMDKALSEEIDRLNRLISKKVELSKDTLSIKIEASSGARESMIGGIFGRDVQDRITALPAAVPAQNVVDAELVD